MTSHPHLAHLRKAYPKLRGLFSAVRSVSYPPADSIDLQDAFVRVVNSQMLSTKAATAILDRIRKVALEKHYNSLNQLTNEEFRECGMSRGKIRSIREFSEKYAEDPDSIERWRILSYEDLCVEVDKIWGVSTWTAQMLAMFYFGNQDVFPMQDLAIRRGAELVKKHIDPSFDPDLAKPYRTLLARCLWLSYDVDYWSRF